MTKIWIAAIVLCLYAYVAYRLIDFQQWQSFLQLMSTQPFRLLAILILELILLGVNLFLEAVKWRYIIAPIQTISVSAALRSTLMALALGNITPARTGEHVGRVLSIAGRHRNIGLALSLLSSMAQTAVIVLALLLSLPFILEKTIHSIDAIVVVKIIFTLGTILLLLTAAAYLLLGRSKIRFTLLKIRLLLTQKIINISYLSAILSLSTLRYLVFAIQLGIMLYVMQPQTDPHRMATLIPAYFFLITIIPSFFFADIGIKGSVALFIFSDHSASELAVLAAMFAIWIINSAIPTLLGSIIITQNNMKDNINSPSI